MFVFTVIDFFTVIAGILEKVTWRKGVCFVDFRFGYRLLLKGCDSEFVKMLKKHIGEKIGIERTNVPGHEYIMWRIRSKRYFDTTKKRNRLDTAAAAVQVDKTYSYMRKWRHGIHIDPYKKIKGKPQPLSDFDTEKEDMMKR